MSTKFVSMVERALLETSVSLVLALCSGGPLVMVVMQDRCCFGHVSHFLVSSMLKLLKLGGYD